MKNKKVLLIIFFIVLLSNLLFSNHNEYLINNETMIFNFNKKLTKFNKIKSLIIPANLEESSIDQYKVSGSYIFLRESIEDIFNNKTYSNTEPDLFIIFTFINSLYYLMKFKLNLWIYNKSIFFENRNKFKPYFNINYMKKLILLGLNINL